jgi:hypothetical protein
MILLLICSISIVLNVATCQRTFSPTNNQDHRTAGSLWCAPNRLSIRGIVVILTH